MGIRVSKSCSFQMGGGGGVRITDQGGKNGQKREVMTELKEK